MTHLVVLFDDAAALTDKLSELNVAQGTHLDLLYVAPNRPSRMKRWVSHNGWQRLSTERGRKLAAGLQPSLLSLGATFEVHAVVGDALQMATEMSHSTGAKMIDARAPRFDAPVFEDSAQDAAEGAAKLTVAAQPHVPKVVYKSALKRHYSLG